MTSYNNNLLLIAKKITGDTLMKYCNFDIQIGIKIENPGPGNVDRMHNL